MKPRQSVIQMNEIMKKQGNPFTEDVMEFGFTTQHGYNKEAQCRMKNRPNKKRCLCYPEDAMKHRWDMIVAIALIMACSMTPIFIAFHND